MNEWKELLDFERVFFEEVAIKLTEKWDQAGKSLNTILRVDYDLNDPDSTSIEFGKKYVIYFEIDGTVINCLSNIERTLNFPGGRSVPIEELDQIDGLSFDMSDPETTPVKVADGIFDTMGNTLIAYAEECYG